MTGGSTPQTARRTLVMVNEGVSGSELRDALVERISDDVEKVFVVAPAFSESGVAYVLGDVDEAIPPARDRLEETLAELRDAGFDAEGEVGDSDPIQAINDEVIKFGPDQIILVAHRGKDEAFAEHGLLEQAERDLELPVTEIVVDRADDPHVVDVEKTDPKAGRGEGWRPSFNWPPLSRRDVAGIVAAIVGTLILGALAADCVGAESGGSDADGTMSAACVARMLIALAFALLNLAHVVGLLLFESVSYEGIWSRFVARLSLIGTPIAVVVSLLLGLFM